MQSNYTSNNFTEKINYFIYSALAFSVSFAWNSVFQNYIKDVKYLKTYDCFVYATIVTGIAIGITYGLHKLTQLTNQQIANNKFNQTNDK